MVVERGIVKSVCGIYHICTSYLYSVRSVGTQANRIGVFRVSRDHCILFANILVLCSLQSMGSSFSTKRHYKRGKTRCTVHDLFKNADQVPSTNSLKNGNVERYSDLNRLYPPLNRGETGCGKESTDGGPITKYSMKSEIRGPLFIINNFYGANFERRSGSSYDVGELIQVFGHLNFSTAGGIRGNLTSAEMITFCRSSASRDYSRVDCLVMVILTHGCGVDLLQGVDGSYVKLEQLVSPFYADNSPTLIGKPKIFLIQACRGDKSSVGVEEITIGNNTSPEPGIPDYKPGEKNDDVPESSATIDNIEQETSGETSGLLPRNADIVIAYSTSDNGPSYRSATGGSYFIHELTNALYQNTKKRHLVDSLTYVQGRMSNVVFEKKCVQMPEFRSTLRGPVFL